MTHQIGGSHGEQPGLGAREDMSHRKEIGYDTLCLDCVLLALCSLA